MSEHKLVQKCTKNAQKAQAFQKFKPVLWNGDIIFCRRSSHWGIELLGKSASSIHQNWLTMVKERGDVVSMFAPFAGRTIKCIPNFCTKKNGAKWYNKSTLGILDEVRS
jgi:hypothetical protein